MTPRVGSGERPSPGGPDDTSERRRRAEAYALGLLARRPRTVREMRRRLAARGYDEKTVEDLVTRMMRLGYLDDRRFAESWVENRTRCRPSGPALLKHELLQRGVDEKLVREVLTARMTREVETDLAVEAARKRTAAGPPDGSDARAKRRLWDFLRRRGFGAAACQAAMKAVFGPVEELEDVPDDLGGADA